MWRAKGLLAISIMMVGLGLIALPGGVTIGEGNLRGKGNSSESKLRVTVGEPIVLAPEQGYVNQVGVATSRTGAVAAFYTCSTPGHKLHPDAKATAVYKVSRDSGQTWGEEMLSPPGAFVPMSVGLREGGVIKVLGLTALVEDGKLEAKWIRFTDDFLHYDIGTATAYVPDAALQTKWARFYPIFDKGKITELANGDLLAPMYGNLKEDTQYRTMIVRSTDRGRTWHYQATVAYDPKDPNPELIGEYCGYCESSLVLLPNGQLLCLLRTQGSQHAPYRPLYASWSSDEGKTWTKPTPTNPHLLNVWPTLAVLDNGVVACIYGRPGVQVSFSTDNGHTWTNHVTFTDLPEPVTTGYADIVKVGPNKLLAIAGVGPGGTKAFPLTVDRVKD